MKHLVFLLLALLAVHSAWSTTPARSGAGHVDQVAYLQHQEAALATALVQDQRNLVGIRLVASADTSTSIEVPHSLGASRVAVLVDLSGMSFEAPATAIQTPVNWRPLSGYRRPIETPGPNAMEALTRHRCRGGTASALTPHAAIHTSGA